MNAVPVKKNKLQIETTNKSTTYLLNDRPKFRYRSLSFSNKIFYRMRKTIGQKLKALKSCSRKHMRPATNETSLFTDRKAERQKRNSEFKNLAKQIKSHKEQKKCSLKISKYILLIPP